METSLRAKDRSRILAVSIAFYAVGIVLMAVGTVLDWQIDFAIFNPQSKFAIGFEAFGLFVYWGMWGPLFSVLFLTRHDLKESVDIISRVFPFIRPIQNTETKIYKVFNFIVRAVTTIGFFVLTVVGWKKVIQNVLKHIFGFNEVTYFIISAVVAVISIAVFSRLSKQTLRKLEYLALAGVLMGIFIKLSEEGKTITERVRFREMVAYSNGIVDDAGMSLGKVSKLHSRLSRDMLDGADFSAFTQWFKKGGSMGIYSNANSFPSGHTTGSCAILMSILFASAFEKFKKAITGVAAFSVLYIFVMGFSRMVCGAHYLTDVAGGALIGYTAFIIVTVAYQKFIKKDVLGEPKQQ
ncbi:MAG: phosphatase PAP2 family protein [Faecalibacterium sp.]|nr:phosphatase PAP2 family protein [Ruminococcus sp.]MCM1392140.1 phosphatase PAP2 family protein [Ruminococcus sp.]MCM1485878.1 phosphatase PAP2 family protein [Faecalibacterium sp.]